MKKLILIFGYIKSASTTSKLIAPLYLIAIITVVDQTDK